MRTPQINEFKAWAQANSDLAKAVLLAQAFAKIERERVDAYILPMFESRTFYRAKEWGEQKRITRYDDLYLTDPHGAEYLQFCADCDAAHRAHGFTGEAGCCPALIAEDLRCKAESALIDAGCKLMGIDHIYNLEHRAKMLKLLLGACLIETKEAA